LVAFFGSLGSSLLSASFSKLQRLAYLSARCLTAANGALNGARACVLSFGRSPSMLTALP
ncbi:MAG: hypothetical protein M0Z55_02815, partial [Peptococcaceae bacterium]|nr:hypothetical protein [Peptococcaceae bacterium]